MLSEDREHVERVLAGESEAFENLVRKYNRWGGAIAYSVVGDFDLAEDIVQESFLKAYRSLGSLRAPERFRVWFAGIVKKTAIDVLRQRRPAAFSGREVPATQSLKDPENMTDLLLREEQRQKVREAVAELPEDDRLVVVLKHMEGLSYKEISEITGASISAVESRLFRARQALKKIIAHLLS